MISACARDVLQLDWRRPNRSRYGKWNDFEETGGHEPNEAPYTEIHRKCILGATKRPVRTGMRLTCLLGASSSTVSLLTTYRLNKSSLVSHC